MGPILFILFVVFVGYIIVKTIDGENLTSDEKWSIINDIKDSRNRTVESENLRRYNESVGSPISYSEIFDAKDVENLAKIDWIKKVFRKTMKEVSMNVKKTNDELQSYGISGTKYTISIITDTRRYRTRKGSNCIEINPSNNAKASDHSFSKEENEAFDLIRSSSFWDSIIIQKGTYEADVLLFELRKMITSEMGNVGVSYKFKIDPYKQSIIYDYRKSSPRKYDNILEYFDGTALTRLY